MSQYEKAQRQATALRMQYRNNREANNRHTRMVFDNQMRETNRIIEEKSPNYIPYMNPYVATGYRLGGTISGGMVGFLAGSAIAMRSLARAK